MNTKIVEYINKNILPQYNNFDGGHKVDHANKVIENSLEIAKDYDVNKDMVYVIAAYHDVGLINGRENHHIDSGKMLISDINLLKWFTQEDLLIMAEAVVDHRASSKNAPRSIYGKIVADADRDINYEEILRRTIEYSYNRFPDFTLDWHIKRITSHIESKYKENGYLNLWLDNPKNLKELSILRDKLENMDNVILNILDIIKNNKIAK